MFEFQGNRDNPQELLNILERFTWRWFESPHEHNGVSEERLAQVPLPDPLRRLYGFAGEWPGGIFESVFSHQDHLVPFECLHIKSDKLVFVIENQNVWECATETSGEDPPVFIAEGDEAWQPLCDSLSQFLVSFCLHECVFGGGSLCCLDNYHDVVKSTGKLPIPLWIDGPYASSYEEGRQVSFHMIEGHILVMNESWCATSSKGAEEMYPEFFPKNMRTDPPPKMREVWEIPIAPKYIKLHHLQSFIRRHTDISQLHADKAAHYQRILDRLENE